MYSQTLINKFLKIKIMEVKSFVNEVMARLKGDDDKVVAERNYRKANSAIKGQISGLDAKKVDAEVALEEAQDKLAAAKYPTKLINDNSNYVRNIVERQEAVDSAKEALENINESLSYFQGLYDEFNPKS